MEPKELLRQLWKIEADDTSNGTACRFQLHSESGPTEYTVCSKAVLLDYAPAKTREPGKLFKIAGYELKKLDDASKVTPEVMLCEESLTIQNDDDLERFFLPLNNWQEIGLGVFDKVGDQMVLRSVMPYLKSGSFQFAGLAIHHIPDRVRWEIAKNSSLTQLNARIGKMRTGPVLLLLLSCDTAMLIVTLSKIQPKEPENSNISMGTDKVYRLDGVREGGAFFTRLVKGRTNLKGLANPVARNKAAEVPPPEPCGSPGDSVTVEELKQIKKPLPEARGASEVLQLGREQIARGLAQEAQVEEVQPEQADAIAEAAPEAISTSAPAEEPKKRTRTKRVAVAPSANASKLIDDLITYLGTPVADAMTTEQMQEEVRKLRDLGVVLARRQSNLFTAATASEKKLRDVLRGVLG